MCENPVLQLLRRPRHCQGAGVLQRMVSLMTSDFSQSLSGGLPAMTVRDGAKPNFSQIGTHNSSGLEEANAST